MLSKLRTRLEHLTPAQALFFLSPLLGEVVSGYLSPLEVLNPLIFVITVVPYGCGALIVRELLVRYRKGWISLVLLGLAFGLFFEGIVTRVLFNPNWEDLGALADYTHVHGFNWTLAVGIVHFQAVVSIICAVLLAEIIYPEQRDQSWISTRTLVRCCVALPGWTLVIGAFVPFVPPLPGAFALVGLVGLLILLALTIPAEPLAPRPRSTSPLVFGLIAGIGMTLIMLGTYVVPEFDSRPPMTAMLAALLVLVAVELGALTLLTNGGRWTDRQRLAMVIGFLAFFLVFGIGQDFGGFTGRSLVSLATAWQLRRLWQKLGARERGDLPVEQTAAEG
jgi:hypothetical protein